MTKAKYEHNGQEITAEFMTISPAAARDWLARNNNIRKLNERRAHKIARDIIKGHWNVNGETFKFDANGLMSDGQTRSRAIVIANKPVVALVVKGVADSTNVDTGKRRTLSQILQALGHQSATALAGAVNYYYFYEQAQRFSGSGSVEPATYKDALEFLEANPLMAESMSSTIRTRTLFGRWSLHAALHFIFAQRTNRDFADDFYRHLCSGVGLKETDPIYLLRERMINEYRSDGRLTPDAHAGMTIKGWNYWLDARKLKSFQYSYGKDGVPSIKGFAEAA